MELSDLRFNLNTNRSIGFEKMERKILGLIVAVVMAVGLSGASEAKVNFSVYLGVPYYDSQISPDYMHDENHGWYQPSYQNGGGRKNFVCLVTFFRRDQVNAGADADVQRAQILPRRIAQRYVRANGRNRIFVYGSNQKTRETCRYLNGLNNQQQSDNQDLVCLVTFFQRDQVNAGADADVERAEVLPRRIAEQRVGLDSRNRIFVYGSNQKTIETCRYLNGINN